MKPKSARPRASSAWLPTLAAAAAPVVLGLTAEAQVTSWIGPAGTGDWSVPANWSAGAVPGNNADVRIAHTDAADRTVTYDYAGPSVSLASLLIDQAGGATDTLLLAGNRLNVTADMHVGSAGRGAVVQSGGTNTVSGWLKVGYDGGYGEYTLSGGLVSASPVVGYHGGGAFKHSGGTVSGGWLYLQADPGQTSSYLLSGTGELRTAQLYIKGPGPATFTQTGGLTAADELTLNSGAAGGTLNLVGGTFAVASQSIGVYPAGLGAFNHTGGTNTASTLYLGKLGGRGTYDLSATGTLSATTAVTVGFTGDGTFKQSGGLLDAKLLTVGDNAAGTYQHTAGFARATTLNLGNGTGGAGIYNLSGGGLTVADTATVGVAGNATFNHSGGTNWVSSLTVAASNNRASYTLSDTASLSVTSLLTLGRAGGNGTFTQTGGTNYVGNSLWVGDGQGGFASGRYALDGGGLTVDRRLEVGRYGATGTFDHSGGTARVYALAVGTGVSTAGGSASVGTYTLGGAGSLTVGNESIGVNNGSGTFRQTGGTHVLQYTSLLLASDAPGSVGTFELSGGSFSNPGAIVGGGGKGTFTHSGGTHTVDGELRVAAAPTGSATYTLSAAAALKTVQTTVGLSVGGGGPASFQQSGGSHLVTGGLVVYAGAAYALTGGTLTAPSLAGDGTFTQDGGTAQLGPIDGAGSLSVRGGRLTAVHVRQSALTVDGTGTVQLSPNGRPSGTSKVATLTLGPSATLDLADNALVVDYPNTSPLPTLRDRIIAARHGGAWDAAGITSSTARANPAATALGYAEAADLFGPAGGTFMGQSVDATAVLVRYTRLGDANLDGTVNFDDLLALAKNYNGTPATLGAGGWSRGDFTYDGTVNFDDLLVLARNYNTTAPSDPLPGAPAGFDADLAQAFAAAAVPEPSALSAALLGACGALSLPRRRRAS